MNLNKIDEEQFGKEFCGFINDIKTHKNPKSFEKDESNFFSLLFNLKSDKEKIKAINGWRDYINELVVNSHSNRQKIAGFYNEDAYKFFISYQKKIISDEYFDESMQKHEIFNHRKYEDLFIKCIEFFNKNDSIKKADISYIYSKLHHRLNTPKETLFIQWINEVLVFDKPFKKVKTLNEISISGNHFEREELWESFKDEYKLYF
tara:strand:- start:325 stop:939 length:615 start_codon:yes stop_codon:yes gene_type:complete